MAQICDLPFTRSHLDTSQQPRALPTASLASLDTLFTITKIDPATVCQWEDDFQLLCAQRDADQQRWYTARDIKRIFALKKLILDQDIPPAFVAATLAESDLFAPPPPETKATPAATQAFLATIKAIEELCAGPLAHYADAPEQIPPVIADVAALARDLFAAAGVQCWLAGPDNTWEVSGAPNFALGCEREARKLIGRVCQSKKPSVTTVAKMATLAAFPLSVGDDILGALLIARMPSQRLTPEEKLTATIIAAQITHALLAARACLQERATTESWQAILNALPDAVMIRNAAQTIVYYNQAALDLAGNRAEIIAAKAAGLTPPRPTWDTTMPDGSQPRREDLASVRALVERSIIPSVHMHMRVPGQSQPTPVLVSAAPLAWGDDELLSVVIVQDISSTKAIEKLKDNFVQSVCHDMNAPLAAMLLAGDAIGHASQKCLDQIALGDILPQGGKLTMMKCYAGSIMQCVQSIRRMLSDLNALPEAVLGPPARMSLADFVDMRVRELQTIYGKHRFVLNLYAADTRLEGYWYRRDIECLVNNLLVNAVKYSPPETTITVELRQEVSDNQQHVARLIVKDRGYGIAEDALDHIFEKHARATTTDEQGAAIEGYGLGLHFCRQLVKLYNGFLTAKSAGRNQGSEFHLRLPLAEAEE